MILWLYNLALLIVVAVASPWWLVRMATTGKYREGIRQRLGMVPQRVRRERDLRPAIWLHAVSVGEVIAISRLVEELEAALPEYRLLISTTTRTGQSIARERFGKERVFYCPLDLPWATALWLRAIRPELLVLAETEFWPNLLSGCFRRGIPVVVVNARISDRSWPRYQRLLRLWKPLLRRLTLALAQSEVDSERLRRLGCGHVVTVGNLKFDIRQTTNSAATTLLQRLSGNLRLVVAGSTLEGEERMLVDAWKRLTAEHSDLAMVLAPRHPERFSAVAGMLASSEVLWRKRSLLDRNSTPIAAGEIVLLDSVGELGSVYSLATVAFVGGSLVAAGGHNPLEPAQFGVPIVMGRHYANFRAIVESLLADDAIRITEAETLSDTLDQFLCGGAVAEELGARGRRVFDRQAGATRQTVEALTALIATSTEERARA